MKKRVARKIIWIILFLIYQSALSADTSWQKLGGEFCKVHSLTIDNHDPKIIYAGTDKFVFKSKDAGKSWKRVLSLKGDYTTVNFIESIDRNLFAATGAGLFMSSDKGGRWKNVYKGKSELERNCLCVAKANKLFLGTQGGLLESENASAWHKVQGELANKEVHFLLVNYQDPNIIYALSPNELYKSTNNGSSWEKIYVYPDGKDLDAPAFTPWDEEEMEDRNIQALAMDDKMPNIIYLFTKQGLLRSENAGVFWQKFNSQGLPSSARLIKVIMGKLYVVSKEGVFRYSGEKWDNIYQGLGDINCLWLTNNNAGDIFLATSTGILKLVTPAASKIVLDTPENILEHFRNEPSIEEVHKHAISYNDVDNAKIKDWRKRMRLRALMPAITLDYDKTVAYYGSTSNGGQFNSFVGPKDWALQFKWDVAELVWNSYEDDVDSRSRYMVQLRGDILDEITRLYFERRQLQVELLSSPPEDKQAKIERELRLQELTANIDALTGGYFSRRLSEMN